jgi:YegS/Rv2252/BmrU family lipid kinase
MLGDSSAISVIVNPHSGSASEELRARIAQALPGCSMTVLRDGADLRAVTRRAVEQGARCVVAVGGDGTVSGVAAELIGTKTRLGIVPGGTANSIAAVLGIPDAVEEACAVIAEGQVRIIDTARVGDRSLLLMATIGLHAQAVISASDEAKAALGSLAYLSKGVELLLGAEPFDVELTVHDPTRATLTASVHALTIANMAPPHSIFAQGPPEVIPDDGLLDVTLVAFDGVLDAFATSFHLYRNALEGLPSQRDGVVFLRARRVAVRASPEQRVMIDGELTGSTPFEVECRPETLAVLAPKRA